jgi:hypothetical protein
MFGGGKVTKFLTILTLTFCLYAIRADSQDILVNGNAGEDIPKCSGVTLTSEFDPSNPDTTANTYDLVSTAGSPWDVDALSLYELSNGDADVPFLYDGVAHCPAPAGGVAKGDTIYVKHSDGSLSTSSASAEEVGEAMTSQATAGKSFELYYHPKSIGGGGGAGSVTSVGGGTGITNSPEPITSTGTVDLDIDSLTGMSAGTIAGGDEFACVDVSVGTSPSSQRKVTATDIDTWIKSQACNTDDESPIGDGSTPPVCTPFVECNAEIGEVAQYDDATNSWSCVNILSETGGGTPFDVGRHFMFGQSGNTAGQPVFAGIQSGELGTGTGVASPTSIDAHISLRRCATASGSDCGLVGVGNLNAHGVLRWRFDVKIKSYYTSSGAGADETLFRFWSGIGTDGSALLPINCSSAGGTDNLTGYWMCFEKSIDASWQACSGDGSDWDCDDTGVAAPSNGDIWDMRIDARTMTSVNYYLNGSLVGTRTTLLPSTTSTQICARTVAARTTAITTQVQVGLGFIEATWD